MNDTKTDPVAKKKINKQNKNYVSLVSWFSRLGKRNVSSWYEQLQIVKEPISKKCIIKGDNLCVTGSTKNLHILNHATVISPGLSGPPQHSKYVVF